MSTPPQKGNQFWVFQVNHSRLVKRWFHSPKTSQLVYISQGYCPQNCLSKCDILFPCPVSKGSQARSLSTTTYPRQSIARHGCGCEDFFCLGTWSVECRGNHQPRYIYLPCFSPKTPTLEMCSHCDEPCVSVFDDPFGILWNMHNRIDTVNITPILLCILTRKYLHIN